MRVVDPVTVDVRTDDHPTGALGFRYLAQGRDGTPENFVMLVAENLGRFEMVRHRHNFDQFRFAIAGDMTMGDGRLLREGHLGYFPEGTSYGPQEDDAGPVCFVLQFGGASGYGYMSPEQYRAGRDSLKRTGHFEGPVYIRDPADGRAKKTFSINAIWEESMGSRMLIPAPRYDAPIFMNPRAFRWRPMRGNPKVFRKLLGTFSEREVSAEMYLLQPGGGLEVDAGQAIKLLFVVDGSGAAGNDKLTRHCGVQIEPDESTALVAKDRLTILAFTLPLIDHAAKEPEIDSFEPVPGEAVPEAV